MDKLFRNKEKKRIFVTSALPYVNNQPHLGNVIGSLLSADVYARYCRRMGYETLFICGTDEYGTATEMEALKQKCHPLEIVKKNRVKHRQVYDWFGMQFDSYGNTHCEEHGKLVHEIFLKIIDYFSEKDVTMMYCLKCDQYLADRFLSGTCECGGEAHGDQCDTCGKCYENASELRDLKCVICGNEPGPKTTRHLFLNLDQLQKHVKKIDTTEWSENAKQIYQGWIKMDIRPRCMTRSLKHSWGVSVPLKGYEDKVFYVWFDAPIGYLTYLKAIRPLSWLEGAKWVQFMGKDNVPFHSVMFPSVLYALKEQKLRTPEKVKERKLIERVERASLKKDELEMIGEMKSQGVMKSEGQLELDYGYVINATEYLTFNKKKFSKSKNVGIFGLDLVEKDLGDATKWRFYLLKRRPETKDADFNTDEFIKIVQNELIANIGNFINRTLKYVESNNVDVYRVISKFNREEETPFARRVIELIDDVNRTNIEYFESMENARLRNGLDKVLEISRIGNKFLQSLQNDKGNMAVGFSFAFCLIKLLAQSFEPFIPDAFVKLECLIELDSRFHLKFEEYFTSESGILLKKKVEIVFNKFTSKQEEELLRYK
ncbi:SYMC [Enterospora canceri]|uniref:methionine--tRNA ligase n=1 Tax=Enterospora canceri TaxID=1081671 RepID=A0A1Y1S503_9MICR|nr:SYMC [Enterospora canceri]